MTKPKALIISLSGPSSSGKTTLARLIRDIFPSGNTFILHEDDFYLPEEKIPKRDGVVDWDCESALDIGKMIRCLGEIRETGGLPEDLESKEDLNYIGSCPVSNKAINGLSLEVENWSSPNQPGSFLSSQDSQTSDNTSTTSPGQIKLCILDGFLLYTPSLLPLLQEYLDIKFFLPSSFALTKKRREARSGYVTLEGFWEDPGGYVENIVWPNYVEGHAWLFEGGDVEGGLDGDVVRREGIEVMEGGERDLEKILKWMVGRIMDLLPGLVENEEV